MAKKYIVLKARTLRKLYIVDILKVHSIEKRKTPKVPSYEDHETIDSDCHVQKIETLSIPVNGFFIESSLWVFDSLYFLHLLYSSYFYSILIPSFSYVSNKMKHFHQNIKNKAAFDVISINTLSSDENPSQN